MQWHPRNSIPLTTKDLSLALALHIYRYTQFLPSSSLSITPPKLLSLSRWICNWDFVEKTLISISHIWYPKMVSRVICLIIVKLRSDQYFLRFHFNVSRIVWKLINCSHLLDYWMLRFVTVSLQRIAMLGGLNWVEICCLIGSVWCFPAFGCWENGGKWT